MEERLPQSGRIHLSPEQRQRLAEIAECDPATAGADLDRLEEILNDHQFKIDVFESPKPNEVREILRPRRGSGLREKADTLLEALKKVPWQLSPDFKARDLDLEAFRKQVKHFVAVSEEVLASYKGEKTPRRPRERVRDHHTIPEIADLCDRLCGREDDQGRDWDYTDRQCAFVALALECAGIPCPKAGNTRLGEARQGRLRRLLKAHREKRRGQRAKPVPAEREERPADPDEITGQTAQ